MALDLEDQYDKIYRYCYFKVHNNHVAEDLTQETFLRYISQTSYRNQGKQLAYLYMIAKNLCIDFYRRKQTVLLSEDYAAENLVEQMDNKIAVQQAVRQLSVELQELILLRYVNELSASEIGEIMEISRFCVYRREKEALKILQKLLGDAI